MKPYGVLKLTATSPAQTFTEPLTVDEVKHFLRLPVYSPADTSQDAELEVFITAAREQAELLQQRPLVGAQYDLRLDTFPCEEIDLFDGLSTVDLVQYTDSDNSTTAMAETTDYIVDTVRGLIMPPYGGSWPSFNPWPSSAVLVRFTVAPPAVNDIVRLGMLLLIAAWHEGRLPFDASSSAIQEYPYSVTNCLSWGQKVKVN